MIRPAFLALLFVCLMTAQTQTQIDYNKQVKNKPITSGAALPGSCTIAGNQFLLTTTQVVYTCNGTTYQSGFIVTSPGTGAVPRTMAAKLAETVSVLDYGATGNGVTDDTAAIQAAETFAESSGGTVYFPCGTYLLSGSGVIVHSPKVNLRGADQACVVINYNGTGRALTIQMVPFTTNPAGEYSGFTIVGTASGSEGILSGQIVSSHWHDITVSGFTSATANGGLGGAGIHLHNAGNFSTWTERNDFQNVTVGGLATAPVNRNGFLLDSDNTGDSFGYNRYIDIKFNTNSDQVGFNLASGFMYNNFLTAIFNMDASPAGTNGPIAIRSNGNWDNNFIAAQGEALTGSGTGATAYATKIESGGRFANLRGSNLNILATGGAQLPVLNLRGSSAAQDATLVEMSQITSWDTGTYTLNGIATTPQPIQRANFGSLGLLIGNNIESPYVSMFQGTGNQFSVLTVPTAGVIGTSGVDVAHVSTFGDLTSFTYKTQCNSLVTSVCQPVSAIDGSAPIQVGAIRSAHRSGNTNLYFESTTGINESMSGDVNFSGGFGYFIGTNQVHPLVWSYTLDPINFGVMEKTFQSPLATTGKTVFEIRHGAIDQGSLNRNIAGSCTTASGSCTWSFTNAFTVAPICVGSPQANAGSAWGVTASTTGCTVTGATTGVAFSFVVVGNPN